MSYLDNLRKKPDSYKKTFSFVVSGGVTMMVLALWIVSFVHSATSGQIAEDTSSNSFSPFSVISGQLGSIVGHFREEVAGIGFINSFSSDQSASSTDATSTDTSVTADSTSTMPLAAFGGSTTSTTTLPTATSSKVSTTSSQVAE